MIIKAIAEEKLQFGQCVCLKKKRNGAIVAVPAKAKKFKQRLIGLAARDIKKKEVISYNPTESTKDIFTICGAIRIPDPTKSNNEGVYS